MHSVTGRVEEEHKKLEEEKKALQEDRARVYGSGTSHLISQCKLSSSKNVTKCVK
jgi:hypothetical protein